MKLDRRISLERKTTAQDSHGQPIETWTENCEVWANRRDLSASERFRADQELATITAVFTIRWFSGMNAGGWRVNDGGVILDIEGIAEPRGTRRQWLELTCTATGA